MSALILCSCCKNGQHDRCQVGYHQKGVIGGWTCSCTDPVCLDERKKRTSVHPRSHADD